MDIAKDLNKQLVDQINKMFAIQINEAADGAKDAHLLMCVRYVYLGRISGDLNICKEISGSSDAEDPLDKLIAMTANILEWSDCIEM
jgi:hypothetical protein